MEALHTHVLPWLTQGGEVLPRFRQLCQVIVRQQEANEPLEPSSFPPQWPMPCIAAVRAIPNPTAQGLLLLQLLSALPQGKFLALVGAPLLIRQRTSTLPLVTAALQLVEQ